MASPIKYAPYEFYVSLTDLANLTEFLEDPTIGTGDFKVSQNGGAFANLETKPVVSPAGSFSVKINLSGLEMNADKVTVSGEDQTGGEWQDIFVFMDPLDVSVATEGTITGETVMDGDGDYIDHGIGFANRGGGRTLRGVVRRPGAGGIPTNMLGRRRTRL